MTTLLRCNQPHWLGNEFVDVGTVLPAGHAKAIPEFYVEFDVEETPDVDALRAKATDLGIKVDKRWGADRLSEEIAAISKT